MINQVATLRVSHSIERHLRRVGNTEGGLGLSPDRPNRKFGGSCALDRQRSGKCYQQQRRQTLADSKTPVEALRAWLLLFVDAVETKQSVSENALIQS